MFTKKKVLKEQFVHKIDGYDYPENKYFPHVAYEYSECRGELSILQADHEITLRREAMRELIQVMEGILKQC